MAKTKESSIKSKLKIKKPLKSKSKANNKKLIEVADSLWSKIVKSKDGNKCINCGKAENLNSHHVIHKSKSKNLRWNPDNGVTLCYACHIHGIHNGSIAVAKRILDYIGAKKYTELDKLSKQLFKADMNFVIEKLKAEARINYNLEL